MDMRTIIIKSLEKELKNSPHVFAMWLEGADAHNRVDKYSDIDIWFSVEDKREEDVFSEIKRILGKIAPVDLVYKAIEDPLLKVKHRYFHLKNTSQFLIIDISIRSFSRKFWFTEGYEDEKTKIIFDKKNVIQYRPAASKLNETKERIKELEEFFQNSSVKVLKEIKRKKFLEAFGSYQKHVLQPLIELLRLKFCPTKSDFYLTKISNDLPKEYTQQIEKLYKVSSIRDIQRNQIKVKKLFNKITKIKD